MYKNGSMLISNKVVTNNISYIYLLDTFGA